MKSVQVGIWDRRDPADAEQAAFVIAELNKVESGWAVESEEDDGIFLVTVSDAFAEELQKNGFAERMVQPEFILNAESL